MSPYHRDFRSYWSSPGAPMSLGCVGCPDLMPCGGQEIEGHGFDCLDHCCKQPINCNIVCPNSSFFVDRVREVAGFDLAFQNVPTLNAPMLPNFVPLIFHGSSRDEFTNSPVVAIPLYRFFNRLADCRFESREDLCMRFKLDPSAKLLLSGVAKDIEVERWWKLESKGRSKVVSNLHRLGVTMVTTPNFSVVVDRPRWDDLHSIKRIAAVYHEFVSEGLSAALHVNGRTQRDYDRWTSFIVQHPEVSHIAFEFTTGTGNPLRMKQHSQWLIDLSHNVGRRLGLVVRGGSAIIRELSPYFDVTFLGSSSFEKAHHRFSAMIGSRGERFWISQHTPPGETVDKLFHGNVETSKIWLRNLLMKLPLAA